MMTIHDLIRWLSDTLQPELIKDYCPNGLQVEGKTQIHKIVTGVTASEALIDAAIEARADAILVHHGYFWKGEKPEITGMKRRRLKKLLSHDINLLGYHLPIDVHPELGNNAQLGKLMGMLDMQPVASIKPNGVLMRGRLASPIPREKLVERLANELNRQPLLEPGGSEMIETAAWCTGGGQGYIDAAADIGVDVFISGEISEQTTHSARECGINFIAAGHHATERYGAKAVGEKIAESFDVDVEFIDIYNPA